MHHVPKLVCAHLTVRYGRDSMRRQMFVPHAAPTLISFGRPSDPHDYRAPFERGSHASQIRHLVGFDAIRRQLHHALRRALGDAGAIEPWQPFAVSESRFSLGENDSAV